MLQDYTDCFEPYVSPEDANMLEGYKTVSYTHLVHLQPHQSQKVLVVECTVVDQDTVSYTHLDVYKRQTWSIRLSMRVSDA